MVRLSISVFICVVAISCGDATPGLDAASGVDADPGSDAGAGLDTPPLLDAAASADSGSGLDAAASADSGSGLDAAASADAGSGLDAAPGLDAEPGLVCRALAPTADVYLENGSTRNETLLRVENSASRERVSYLKFSVSGVPSVASAVLSLRCEDDPGALTVQVLSGGHSDWSETDITANGAPPAQGQPSEVCTSFSLGQLYHFDVSPFVAGEGVYTFVVRAEPNSDDVAFSSREGVSPPTLTLNLEHAPNGTCSAASPDPLLPVTQVEAEAVTPTGAWVRESTTSGCSGDAYLRWGGGDVHNKSSISSDSILSYTVTVVEEGEYLIVLRSQRDRSGPGSCRCSGDDNCNDECNDVWLRINGEPWIKKMAAGDWGEWMDNGRWQYNHHPTGVSHAEAYLRAGVNTIAVAGRSKDVKIDRIEVQRAQKYRAGDLISIHHDNARDIDDAMATAANYSIVSELGLAALVVNGAYGWQAAADFTCPVCGLQGLARNSFNLNSNPVMDDVWGVGNWFDADADRAGAVAAVAARWLETLDAGGTVWVAEAGQSDFTVAVVKRVRSLGFLDTVSKVRVVQHSVWNEEYTERGASDMGLAYLQWYRGGRATYIHIGNGNLAEETDGPDDASADRPTHTADLSMKSTVTDTAAFRAQARASVYGDAWASAIDYFENRENQNPNYPHPDYVDFSDTVELLYIIGCPTSRIADIQDFAAEFLAD